MKLFIKIIFFISILLPITDEQLAEIKSKTEDVLKVPTFKLQATSKVVTLVTDTTNNESKCTRYVQIENNNIQAAKPKLHTIYFEKVSDDIIIEAIKGDSFNK